MLCGITQDPTPTTLTNYINCIYVQKQVNYVQQWQPLIQAHFLPKDQQRALQIIYCESRGKPNAVGINKDQTRDVGLWQFNDHTWAWLKNKLKFTGNRYDPVLSTKVARWLIYNDGWHHWYSSKHCWLKNF